MIPDDHRTAVSPQASGLSIEGELVTLLQPQKDLLVDYLFQMTGSTDEAVEISLQTSALLARREVLERARPDLRSWLLRRAAKLVRSRERLEKLERILRRRKRRHDDRPIFEEGLTAGAGVAEWERLERERLLRAALATIPLKLRMTLVLREILGLPAEEVGHLTGTGHQELHARVERGRSELRAAIVRMQEEL